MLSHPDSTPPILEPKLEQKPTIEVTLVYTEQTVDSSKEKVYTEGSLSLTFPSKEEGIRFFEYMKKSSPDNLQNINVDQTTGIITLTTFSRNSREFNVNLGSYEAVLSFVAGLGLNSRAMSLSETPQPDEAQISERYTEAGITHYRAITPYALPIEEKLPFSEYFQQTKLYFDKEKISKGLTLTIPTAQALLSLPEPIPYFTVPSILYSIIDAPETSLYASPNVKLQLTSTGALAVEFASKEMAIFALSMLGQAEVATDSTITALIQKQLPKAKKIIPFVNTENPKQLLIPIISGKGKHSLILGNEAMHQTFLSLLNPHDQKQEAEAYEFPLTLDEKSHVCIREKEFADLQLNKILRIFLSHQSFLTVPELYIKYLQVADEIKLQQSVRNVFNNYLKFVKKNNIDLAKEAEKTLSLLPTRAKELIENFLKLKQAKNPIFGGMSLNDYIARLLYNRPAVFVGPKDQYVLWDSTKGVAEAFKKLSPSLYLQYDEIPFAALLILWSKTHFINDGRYDNSGTIDPDNTYAKKGIVSSIVGARLEKEDVCEYRHMYITKKQNTAQNGYGKQAKPDSIATEINKLWAKFYGCDSNNLLSYQEALDDKKKNPHRYLTLRDGSLFNLEIYVKRFYSLIETYLRKLNQDAKEAKTMAYDEALSFGTGCWAPKEIVYIPSAIFPMVYELVIKNNDFSHISDINIPFLKIEGSDKLCGMAKDGEEIADRNGHKICIHFSDHSPQALLEEKHQGKLRKRTIAWDGNAQIGNEFYLGAFTMSGDPAGAAASLVPLYQNPRINEKLYEGMKKGEKIQFHGEEKSPNVDSILKMKNWQRFVGKPLLKEERNRQAKPSTIIPSSTTSITTSITSTTVTSRTKPTGVQTQSASSVIQTTPTKASSSITTFSPKPVTTTPIAGTPITTAKKTVK